MKYILVMIFVAGPADGDISRVTVPQPSMEACLLLKNSMDTTAVVPSQSFEAACWKAEDWGIE